MKKTFFAAMFFGAVLLAGSSLACDIVMERVSFERNCIEVEYGVWGAEKKGEIRFDVSVRTRRVGSSVTGWKTERFSKSVEGVKGRGNTIMFCLQPGTENDVSDLDATVEMHFDGKAVDQKKLYMFRATPN